MTVTRLTGEGRPTFPNGGPEEDWTPPRVSISSPASGSKYPVGSTVVISGTASDDNEVTGVAYSIDGSAAREATKDGFGWGRWSASVTLASRGVHVINVWAGDSSGNVGETSVQLETVDTSPPQLAVLAPTTSSPATTVAFDLFVRAVDPESGIQSLECTRPGAADFVPMSYNPATQTGTARLQAPSATVAAGGTSYPVTIRARNLDGYESTITASLPVVDVFPPSFDFTPADNAQILGTPSGADVDVVVKATDDTANAFTSGVASVTVKVDNGPAVPAGLQADGGWRASVRIPVHDKHAVTVRCTDKRGNFRDATHTVLATLPADVRDLSQQTYLADLIDFATRRLLTQRGGSNITRGHLSEAFGQSFAAVAEGSPAAATRPVCALRLATEVLRSYMGPTPRAPIARWALDEGSGTTARDGTGNHSDGAIFSGSWAAGRAGRSALAFNGNSTYVRLPSLEQTKIRGGLSATAWIRPTAAVPGTIIGRAGEGIFGRSANGTLRWAVGIAGQTTWEWVDTGVGAPQDVWSHVAITYDGAAVRTYLNGALRHERTLAGEVGDISPNDNELRIGAQPSGGDWFQGQMSEVALYDRALTDHDLKVALGQAPIASEVWVNDDIPPGTWVPTGEFTEPWEWITSGPAPVSGSRCHRSALAAGIHQHLFEDSSLVVNRGDILYTYVHLDPANPPRQVMLQWRSASGWEHRAYWGEKLIPWGTDGTPNHRNMGPLPARGQWVQLAVPARLVGLENRTVLGMAFTLYDGRASWDLAGRSVWRQAAAGSGYTGAGYRALLRELGTSYDELRRSRSAPPAVRRSLADRLGIPLAATRPDELDRVLIEASAVTESQLESLFGVPTLDRDPFAAAPPPPTLHTWRLARLRERWRAEDVGVPGVGDNSVPVVDPDLVMMADFRTPGPSLALDLWKNRTAWVTQQTSQLRGATRKGTPIQAITTVLTQVFPTVDLVVLREQQGQGQDVEPAVVAASLTMPAFNRVMELRDLAATGPLLAGEWDELVAILVQVLKVRAYPTWRQEERTRDVLAEPAVFQLPAPNVPVKLVAWRADWAARQAWQERLRARSDQLADLATGLDAAVSAAEEASLPVLLAALVGATSRGTTGIDLADSLTGRLLIDVKVGAQVKTTRIDQVIETLQGVLFAARTSALDTVQAGLDAGTAAPWVLHLRPQYTEVQFDQEWEWMGSYATWRAAISVFLNPENLLLPTFLPTTMSTDVFQTWRKSIPRSGLTPAATTTLAETYMSALREEVPLPPAMTTFVLKGDLTEAQLTERARLVASLAVGSTFAEIPDWVREVFYYVPMTLALALQSSEQYLAALGWMRSVYAYDRGGDEAAAAPKAAHATAFIFAGFRADASGSQLLQRPAEWLLADMNPHPIAVPRASAQLRFTLLSIARCLLAFADSEFTHDTAESRPRARSLYLTARDVLRVRELELPPSAKIPINPALSILRGHAELNLRKLRMGMNIAGMSRAPAPTTDVAVSMPPPTPYHFQTLITRAQQLLAGAAQVEASYLSALEKADAEAYNLLKAGQDLDLAKARVRLQLTSAAIVAEELHLSELQRDRAAIQQRTYSGWIAAGLTGSEQAMLRSYRTAARARDQLATVDFAMTAVQAFAAATSGSVGGALALVPTMVLGGQRADLSQELNRAELDAQVNAFQATAERRQAEWRLQNELAGADFAIGQQQVEIMHGRGEVAMQEVEVAETQQSHAEASVNFLARKFTNADLYRWMSDVLAGVYRYLLQQAASVGRLAEAQLAFERQDAPPAYVKADYWASPSQGNGDAEPDRRGLTGSARLLQDLTALDQYAFETNRRKLQLTHTISLAKTAPVDFQRFRETGVLPFTTPMEMFDRAFPGHYLRLIRSVKVSVVGLIPPVGGIRATLTTSGVSRVVVGGVGGFTTRTIIRPSEMVALASPTNATGVFELDAQPELMRPFEGHGIDTMWEFQLPRAANPFDYRSLADVVLTIEYTALHSPDYAAQVVRELPSRTSSTVSLSARRDTPDAWYLLLAAAGEPPPTGTSPLSIHLPVARRDFPPNVSRLVVEQVTLLAVFDDGVGEEVGVDRLSIARSTGRLDGGPAASVGGLVSTRGGSGVTWLPLVGTDPVGTWQLVLTDTPAMRSALRSGAIRDLVLVLTYGADLPAWPGVGAASPMSAPIQIAPVTAPVNTAVPAIAGSARPGQTLAATVGTWTGDGITHRYQWRRCDAAGNSPVDIAGATAATYTLIPTDEGRTLQVQVTATNTVGSAVATSAPTALVAAAPPANTAVPVITGTARTGQALTATNGTWQLASPTFRRQWRRCDAAGASPVDIPGATGSSYILVAADIGRTLRVVVTATNGAGSTTITTAQTAMVAAGPPVNTVAPTISGAAKPGQVLTAAPGTWREAGPTMSYQWRRCDAAGNNPVNIAGATAATYTLTTGDLGSTVRVVATATNATGSTSVTSAQTALVATAPPTNTALPAIAGTPRTGQALTVSTGTWQLASPTLGYQWRRCDEAGGNPVNIAGATASTYVVVAADIGKTLRVSVTATNGAGATSATSAQTTVVIAGAPVNTVLPIITGAARPGQVLTAGLGTWREAGPTFQYQWRRCDAAGNNPVNVADATGATYTLTAGDEGSTLRVVVTATNATGSTSATSAPTPLVATAVPTNTAPPTISGTARVGQALTASAGTWQLASTSYRYQWRRCDAAGANPADIAGATASTYTVVAADVGGTLRLGVTAINGAGSTSATSAQTAAVTT